MRYTITLVSLLSLLAATANAVTINKESSSFNSAFGNSTMYINGALCPAGTVLKRIDVRAYVNLLISFSNWSGETGTFYFFGSPPCDPHQIGNCAPVTIPTDIKFPDNTPFLSFVNQLPAGAVPSSAANPVVSATGTDLPDASAPNYIVRDPLVLQKLNTRLAVPVVISHGYPTIWTGGEDVTTFGTNVGFPIRLYTSHVCE